MILEKITEEDESGERLDRILCKMTDAISRENIKKSIQAGQCLVDGKIITQASSKVRAGQNIRLQLDVQESCLKPDMGEIEVIWEDEDIVVINKEADMTVHPCASCVKPTLIERLLARYPQLAKQGGLRPGIVHRLDKDTSGLMVVALNEKSRLKLSGAFAEHKIYKEYIAMVYGTPAQHGECELPIGRDPVSKIRMSVLPVSKGGKNARTRWRMVWSDQRRNLSVLAVRIYTGRTHQIRVHLSALGFPIIGDRLYAPQKVRLMACRQLLHAWRIGFTHPTTKKYMTFGRIPEESFFDEPFKFIRPAKRLIITGNPGCGKSAFAAMLAKKGVPVLNADAVVARIYAANSPHVEWLAQRFGNDLLTGRGDINKGQLLTRFGADPCFKAAWEECIHGIVLGETEQFLKRMDDEGKAFIAAEIPLYFECGWNRIFAHNVTSIGIECPVAIRHERLKKTRAWTDQKILEIESWQWPVAQKMAACDISIDNSGSIEALERETNKLLEMLKLQDEEKIQTAKSVIYESLQALEAGGE